MRRRIAAPLLALAASLVPAPAKAEQLHDYYLGARAMAMGGAYVGLADDEQAIFLNPAGLAANQNSALNLVALDTMASTDAAFAVLEGMSGGTTLDSEFANKNMGKNITARVQYAPTFLVGGFGFGGIVDQQIAIMPENQALPQMHIGRQTTMGVQGAYGFTVGKQRKRGRRGARARGGELRLGVGGKALWRRGGYRVMPLSEVAGFSISQLQAATGGYALGFGVDLGAQYLVRPGKNVVVSAGIAYTNAGDVAFGPTQTPIKGNLTLGLGATYEYRRIKVIAAWDYAHILETTDWRKKNRVGLELRLPALSLYGGFHQIYATYGIGFDLWAVKVTALSYAVEHGSIARIDAERRWQLRATLTFPF